MNNQKIGTDDLKWTIIVKFICDSILREEFSQKIKKKTLFYRKIKEFLWIYQEFTK